MLTLSHVTQDDLVALARQIAHDCGTLPSHEAVSQCIVQSLCFAFGTPDDPELALARIYRLTHTSHLPADLRALAGADERYVMALTGTCGIEDDWRDRRKSANHKVVPIQQVAVKGLIPMFEEVLVNGMKVDINRLYETGDVIAATSGLAGTFYIPDVSQSPAHIPAQQEFVEPYGIKSELGYGGLIAGGEGTFSLYTLFLFTRIPVPAETANAFFATRPILGTALATRNGQTVFSG